MALIRRPARRAGVALCLVAVAVLLPAPTAAGHGGGARFEVREASEAEPGQLRVRVAVAHEADGHPAEGAVVEVAATGPGGASVPAAQAAREEQGVYAITLALPEAGAWTIVITSAFPPGTLALPVTVAGAGAARPAPTAGPAAPTTSATVGVVEGAAERDDTVNLIVAGVCGAIGGALGLWVSNRRGRRKRAAAGRG